MTSARCTQQQTDAASAYENHRRHETDASCASVLARDRNSLMAHAPTASQRLCVVMRRSLEPRLYMTTWLKRIGIVVGALLALAILAAAGLWARGSWKLGARALVVAIPAFHAAPSDSAAIARGEHLAVTRGCTSATVPIYRARRSSMGRRWAFWPRPSSRPAAWERG